MYGDGLLPQGSLSSVVHSKSSVRSSLHRFTSVIGEANRVQDNDDLAPLFNQYNEILRQTYGDFFVAELIESQDENNQALVAEVKLSFAERSRSVRLRSIASAMVMPLVS